MKLSNDDEKDIQALVLTLVSSSEISMIMSLAETFSTFTIAARDAVLLRKTLVAKHNENETKYDDE